jgi:hypothetical protein
VASPFTPPNRAALWASLALTKAQLTALCGLSVRQVTWWTQQGYLPRSTHDPERYSGDVVDMAVLITQGLGQGLSLRQAVKEARAYLVVEQARQPDLHALDGAALALMAARIAQANAAARDVLAAVAPLALILAVPGSRPATGHPGARRGALTGARGRDQACTWTS